MGTFEGYDLIAGEVDVFPSEGRQVFKQVFADRQTMCFQSLRAAQINRIPKNDRGQYQRETTAPITLVLEATVTHLTQTVKEDRCLRSGCWQFFDWCAAHGLELTTVRPFHVAAWIEDFPGSKPTIKQKLAAVRMLYDFLVVRQTGSKSFKSARDQGPGIPDVREDPETIPQFHLGLQNIHPPKRSSTP